jgi:hypothetical protein
MLTRNASKDVLLYCDRLETAMRLQNQKLSDELQECKRDNRQLQTQLQNSEAQTDYVTGQNETIRV